VCTKHNWTIVRDLVEFIDKDSAKATQPLDDKAIVDDLVPNIDRRAEALERELYDLDSAVNARAEAARSRDQYAKRGK